MCFLISSCTATEENTNQVAIVDENPGILSKIQYGLQVTGATAFDLGVVAGGALAYTGCTGVTSGLGPFAPVAGSFCSTAFDTAVQALRPTAMDDYSLTKTPIGAQAITIVNIAKGLSGSDLKNLGQATINAGWTFGKNIAYDAAATKVCTKIAEIAKDYDSDEALKRLKKFFPGDQELTKEFLEKWATQSCKSMTIQGINNLEQTAVKSYEADSKKNAAFRRYKEKCKAEGKKPVQRRTWQKKYDSLVKARAEKVLRATQAKAEAEAKAKVEAEAKAKAEAKKKEKQIVEEKKTYQIFVADGQKTYAIDVDKDMSLHDLGKVIKKTTGNQYDYFSSSGRSHQFDKTTVETAGIGKLDTLNLQIRVCGGSYYRPDGPSSSREGGVHKKKYTGPPDGPGSSLKGGVPKKFTGPQHEYEPRLKEIDSILSGRISKKLSYAKMKELQMEGINLELLHLNARNRNLRVDPETKMKVFDDGIQKVNGKTNWNHANAIIIGFKKAVRRYNTLGKELYETRRDTYHRHIPIEDRKIILKGSRFVRNTWNTLQIIKNGIRNIARRSDNFVAKRVTESQKKEAEIHHKKIFERADVHLPELCRQKSLEIYEEV